MVSEMAEKQRRVTQEEMAGGVELLRSRMTIVTRARCVLARSRSNLLALCADSRSGAQMTRLSILVRTLVFCVVRILSAEIFHKRASSSSTLSSCTDLPAHGKRGLRLLVASVMHIPSSARTALFSSLRTALL